MTLALGGTIIYGDKESWLLSPSQAKARKRSQVGLPSQAGRTSRSCQWPSRTSGRLSQPTVCGKIPARPDQPAPQGDVPDAWRL